MNNQRTEVLVSHFRVLAIAATTACALSACASIPAEPTAAFQAADIAIANAEQEHASDFAAAELSSAREKMARARTLVADHPRDKARLSALRLAEQALSDAQLASALARDGNAQAVNAELRKNTNVLREELQRDQGHNQ